MVVSRVFCNSSLKPPPKGSDDWFKKITESVLLTSSIVIPKSLSKIPLIRVNETLIAAKTFVFLSLLSTSVPSKK